MFMRMIDVFVVNLDTPVDGPRGCLQQCPAITASLSSYIRRVYVPQQSVKPYILYGSGRAAVNHVVNTYTVSGTRQVTLVQTVHATDIRLTV